MGMLCVKCGDLGHKSDKCTKPAEAYDQAWLLFLELDLMATFCNEFKSLLTRESELKMVKAKVTSATTAGDVASTEADNPSQHSRILESASIQKKSFRLSAIVNWDINLTTSAHGANQRIIHNLGHSPTKVLLGIQPNPLPQFQAEETSELVHTL